MDVLGLPISLRVLLGTTLGVGVGVCTATKSAPWILDRAALLILASQGRIPFGFVGFLEEAEGRALVSDG